MVCADQRCLIEGKHVCVTKEQVCFILEAKNLPCDFSDVRVRSALENIARVEALAELAKREGVNKAEGVDYLLRFAANSALAELYIKEKVQQDLRRFRLSESDLREYYKAHKDEFSHGNFTQPFSEVRSLIERKLMFEHIKALKKSIVNEALLSEKVKINIP